MSTTQAQPQAPRAGAPIFLQSFDDGDASQKDLLGGKGANLAEMTRMGLPVPPGFTITTEACRAYLLHGGLPDGLMDEVRDAIADLEARTGRTFGDTQNPLLLSVRSGARFSMPGMMDTVLDLGLTPQAREGIAALTGDPRFAADAHRRFLQLFGHVVLDMPEESFADASREVLARHGATEYAELDVDGIRQVADAFEVLVEGVAGGGVVTDPWSQLQAAIEAVFRSWNGRRAVDYRRLEGIPDDLGTAVNVQAMVFGNMGGDSGTGVAFTRDPATGASGAIGDFLVDAQGEDVVAGIRMTEPLSALADTFPACAAELDQVMRRLEDRFRDMCDLEFTIQHGTLYILQTRVGKRTARAAVRMAVEMVDEGLIDEVTALQRVRPEQLDRLLHPQFDPAATLDVVATGLAASPGAASGRVAFTADDAQARAAAGEDVILVRPQTSPEDLHGIIAARGVLTSRGGLVSHAAVVARSIGTPAVCGADAVVISRDAHSFQVGSLVVRDGDVISIDGTTGQVVVGAVPVVAPTPPPELERLLGWADVHRRLDVWTNADTAQEAADALARGATGIGLCRTEHQFLGDRLPVVQRAILASDPGEEAAALAELYEQQREDFASLYAVMGHLPVTIRLLDPPLHEFLPDLYELVRADAAGTLDDEGRRMFDAATAWHEENPMLGIRGVRLGLMRPGLYEMQVRALVDAAFAVDGAQPIVRIMVPLVSAVAELEEMITRLRVVVEEVRAGRPLDVKFGAMVETPRACVIAADLAPLVDFLSFGTNDLTQLTFGFSRDDVGARLLPRYIEDGVLTHDPFQTFDVDGVGPLVEAAVADARLANPDIEIGVCGEHGGDPDSIGWFEQVGFDEVSCSPLRVPAARLAAARARLAD